VRIIGVSAYYHDSAAALLVDGELVAAAQEERFTRLKHDPGFPRHALGYCLEAASCRLSDIDLVVFYDKPFLKFERIIETAIAFAPKGFRTFASAMPIWLKEKLFQKRLIADELRGLDADFDAEKRLMFSEHHFSHAASAFYPSPFAAAAVLTLDGVGEWATTTTAVGRDNELTIDREIHFPHSLGLLYSAFTYYLGFKVNSGEYKVMGLAPYGRPRLAGEIKNRLIDVKEDGSFWLDQRYFDYCAGLRMTNEAFADLFGQPRRDPDKDLLTDFHMDVAASVQAVLDEVVLLLTRDLASRTGLRNLCLAGGVALNCVANGKILRDGRFKNIWIQPAAGDAGGAVGAAYAAWHLELGKERALGRDGMSGALLGPSYSQDEIETRLGAAGAVFQRVDGGTVIERTASALAEGRIVGWFQGRMEFGPRALGSRSILGDPRSPSMQRDMNLKIKYRESFRPFAPAVLREDVAEWFELDSDSPYMLLVADVRADRRRQMTSEEESLFGIDKLNVPRSTIPAVTHVDYSARIQTVDAETNPRFHQLLSAFKHLTGVPVLVNTSFNVRGEPIVCTPEDAFRCFMGSELDLLVCGDAMLWKREQTAPRANYLQTFAPD
jgi:carbamoyltransferase